MVSFVKVTQSHLQGLRMSLVQPSVFRFSLEFGQQLLGIVVIQAVARFGIMVDSLPEKVIIDKATCSKLIKKLGLLFNIWIKSKPVSTNNIHAYNYSVVFVKEQLFNAKAKGLALSHPKIKIPGTYGATY